MRLCFDIVYSRVTFHQADWLGMIYQYLSNFLHIVWANHGGLTRVLGPQRVAEEGKSTYFREI